MFHTQGIILKKSSYREYDEILTIWTRDFGKIEAIARGVKKPLSKLNGHLQVFDLSDIEFALGKRFKVLTGANLVKNAAGETPAASRAFFNFLDEITPLEDADSRIWQLCLDVVRSPSSVIRPCRYGRVAIRPPVGGLAERQSLLRLTGFAP